MKRLEDYVYLVAGLCDMFIKITEFTRGMLTFGSVFAFVVNLWTRHTLLNIAPKASVNPVDRIQARAWQIYMIEIVCMRITVKRKCWNVSYTTIFVRSPLSGITNGDLNYINQSVQAQWKSIRFPCYAKAFKLRYNILTFNCHEFVFTFYL